ncbi:hypothetical protein [Morganella morganii]|uniref:hypothetical protein n=1 Tax=Morganella morganii TaxID=582 RepID=UPI003EB6FA3C
MNGKYEKWFVSSLYCTFKLILLIVIAYLLWIFFKESKSEVISRVSAFFTMISSLGIAATIWVYFRQVAMKESDEKRELNSCMAIYLHELDTNTFDIIDRVNSIIDDMSAYYNLTFNENVRELLNKITHLNSESRIIKVKIPSIHGYSRNINLPIIAKLKPELFIQIVRESSYIEALIRDFSELKSEISKGEEANNLEIYGYLNDIYKSNNWLREAVESNEYA